MIFNGISHPPWGSNRDWMGGVGVWEGEGTRINMKCKIVSNLNKNSLKEKKEF